MPVSLGPARGLILGLALLAALLGFDAARRPAQAFGILVCSFSMTNEAFGTIDVLPGAPLSTSATLTTTCGGLSVISTVFACVTFPATMMIGPASSSLAYTLIGPAPATTPWSSTVPITFAVPLLGGTSSIAIPATLLANQSSAPPGLYTQTVTASVIFSQGPACTSDFAAVGSFTFTATATVVKSCNVSAGNLAFASATNLSGAIPGQSQINLQCSNGTGYSVGLDGGTSAAADPTQRKMTFGGNAVTYGLYRDAAHGLPWGNTPGSNALPGVGTSLTQTLPVYGLVPVQTTPPAGTYTDTIVVSITF